MATPLQKMMAPVLEGEKRGFPAT